MDLFLSNIQDYYENLIAYRAHLVHKHTEACFDQKFYENMEVTEAVVICDWKMKILSSKYRESQQEWFSKRGSSLLGFEVHLKYQDGSTKVYYHFYHSDDTLQDSEAVLCAKHYLYTKVLPQFNIKKVHFRSDGAGCFSSKESKASMTLFGAISHNSNAAYEVTYKVSVAGCGKTALDVSSNIFIHL